MHFLRRAAAIACALVMSWTAQAQNRPGDAVPDKNGTAPSSQPIIGTSFESQLTAAKAIIDPDGKFRALRRLRSDVARTAEETKARLIAIKADLESKQRNRKAFDDEKRPPYNSVEQLNASLKSAEERLAAIDKEIRDLKPGDANYDQLSKEKSNLQSARSYFQFSIAEVPRLEREAKEREAKINLLDAVILKLQTDELNLPDVLAKQLAAQSTLDDEINDVLRTESQRNNFKTTIALFFAGLVGLVIVGFFVLSYRDEKVRQAIFSSESGIQFLTLFSVVIAIILFGIIGILESKELAALLGGLSGYILGRVTTADTRDKTAPTPQAGGQGQPPQGQPAPGPGAPGGAVPAPA